MVALQAGLDQGAGNHFHLVEKRLVAPFLPLTVNVSSPYGSDMWVKTRSLSKEAWNRQWLLCPCVHQDYFLLQFSISHVQFRISITIFLVVANSAHHPHPPNPFSSLRRATAPFLLLVVRSVAATTFHIKTLDGLLPTLGTLFMCIFGSCASPGLDPCCWLPLHSTLQTL